MNDAVDEIRLSLCWRHGRGAYAAYFAALAEGRALASRDAASGRVSFPPRMGDGVQRVNLAGTGTLVAVTWGPSPETLQGGTAAVFFALVAMDGADNLSFARVLEDGGRPAVGDRVRLVPVPGPVVHPARAAVFTVMHGDAARDGAVPRP
jgi:uncharacterized OB-fold protein